MNTLNFDKPMLDLDGKENSTKLSRSLSEFLATETQGDALKLLGWAECLRDSGVLELDDSDKKKLESTIEGSQRMTVLLKGQLLRCFLTK
jgi:hypothetical protein